MAVAVANNDVAVVSAVAAVATVATDDAVIAAVAAVATIAAVATVNWAGVSVTVVRFLDNDNLAMRFMMSLVFPARAAAGSEGKFAFSLGVGVRCLSNASNKASKECGFKHFYFIFKFRNSSSFYIKRLTGNRCDSRL